MPEPAPRYPDETARYVTSEHYVDSDSAEVQDFVQNALCDTSSDASDKEKAIRLFEAVRDGLRYDPYTFSLDGEDYRASAVARMESAFCVPKAILLTACLRAVGIPAALGFADVLNHLNTPKLTEMMGTHLFIYHGYVQLWLGSETYKVTPAFNMEMCHRFGVKPLEFDGTNDALFHEFDTSNRRHMEYVNDRGLFVDAPIPEFLIAFDALYPKLTELSRRRMTEKFSDPGFAAS